MIDCTSCRSRAHLTFVVPKTLPPRNICYLSDVLIHNDPGNASRMNVPTISVSYLLAGKTESLARW